MKGLIEAIWNPEDDQLLLIRGEIVKICSYLEATALIKELYDVNRPGVIHAVDIGIVEAYGAITRKKMHRNIYFFGKQVKFVPKTEQPDAWLLTRAIKEAHDLLR